jgi:Xaa-Pro dipeptidase
MKVESGTIPETEVPFPRSEYERRQQAALAGLEKAGVDALCVTANTHLWYLTGYNGRGSYFGPYTLVLAPGKRPVFVVRKYDEDSVLTETCIDEVIPYTQRAEQPRVLGDVLRQLGLEHARVGFELDSWNLAPVDVDRIRAELPDMKVVDATRVVPRAAAVKSDLEIETMRRAMAITKAAVGAFNTGLREGISEAELWEAMWDAAIGAGGPLSGSTNVLFGQRTALPHGPASGHRLSRNAPAFTEVAGVYRGYEPGLCRTAILGRHAEAEGLYAVADEALRAAIDAVRPGATAGDLDRACRTVIEKAGRADSFRHRAGYQNGIGWSYRGDMSLEPNAPDVLVPNMTVHLPIILFQAGEFAVGCSESVLVTQAGHETLSGGPDQLVML